MPKLSGTLAEAAPVGDAAERRFLTPLTGIETEQLKRMLRLLLADQDAAG